MNYKRFAWVALITVTISAGPSPATMPASALQDALRNRIESGGIPLKISVGDEMIYSSIVLPMFYERRIFQAAWSNEGGPSPQVDSLLKAIRNADLEGLRSSDYHLEKIETVLAEIRRHQEKQEPLDPRPLVDLDLLLTDAFLIFGSHLLAGRVDPKTVDAQWHVNRREADLAGILEQALASDQIEPMLRSLLPTNSGYGRLRQELARYREIDAGGGWPSVPDGSKLQKGDRGERVSALRNRLAAEGFLENLSSNDDPTFDDALDRALRKFQSQNGLEPDGVVGPQSTKALNVSPDERINRIIANMERWRWLPQELGNRYILVNIAGFYLKLIEDGQLALDMRVVTGKPYRRTPVFSSTMTYLVMNPSWTVPHSIAVKDILPKIKKDPTYPSSQKIKVLQGWGANTIEIDPAGVNWPEISAANFNYRFRQEPGPLNALGRIKFMFPNQFDVYLHDTPSRDLFGKARRAFSSGCIRIEKPLELAEYLLRNDRDWPPEKIRAKVTGTDITEQTVKLPEPIQVYLLYWTVWIDPNNQIHFSPDIYGRDKSLAAALNKPPPER
ncbi:MAG: L,D-transpeptidase family protein [Desulfobacterales bacterium]|nr:MAG: L,D-transpeptidase family protein [Desulfobacterales bacterium]